MLGKGVHLKTTSLFTLLSVSESLVFQIVGRSHRWSLYLKMLGKGVHLKTTSLFTLLSVVIKLFEKLVNLGLVYYLEKYGVFPISSLVLGLLD